MTVSSSTGLKQCHFDFITMGIGASSVIRGCSVSQDAKTDWLPPPPDCGPGECKRWCRPSGPLPWIGVMAATAVLGKQGVLIHLMMKTQLFCIFMTVSSSTGLN